ncbi:head GIN domain-containing protein [Mesonia aestuariivivens]|uniref:DUF2807 domain-containing protein n=1 Tax=Mesonia aestuariivivens TaxID=2796128 RepID=A0ABS6VYC5_9FLAO|nr:head GIN domain-containing protein [Mesonia aestuariivivens]MBW2960612.1 DUF2807 domain-containing protein [Mesonia aestuariivivens]
MRSKLTKIYLVLILSLVAVSCKFDISGIQGKGEIVTKNISLDDTFTEIKTESGWKVKLIKGKENKLEVRANQNLIEQLDYNIREQRLTLGSKNNIQSGTRQLTVYYTENLDLVKSSSGSTIEAKDTFEQENLEIDASSGSSIQLNLKVKKAIVDASSGARIELEGTSIYFEGESSSGSRIKAKKLKTKECDVKASSGGNIDIYNEGSLTAKASSGGNIDYYGNPEKISIHESISGGNIDHEED